MSAPFPLRERYPRGPETRAERDLRYRRAMPRYVGPRRSVRVLPRRVPVLRALGRLPFNLIVAMEEDQPLVDYRGPQVSPGPRVAPVVSRGMQYSTALEPEVELVPEVEPVRSLVPREYIGIATVPVIERGPEWRLSFNAMRVGRGLAMRWRRSEHRGQRKRRRDKKGQDAVLYRAALSFINRTWGRIDELADLYEAIAWNVYIDGVPAAINGWAGGEIEVDYEGLIVDLLMNEVVDYATGRLSRAERDALRKLGYTGIVTPSSTIGRISNV